jgi:mxaJ protein
MNVPQTDAVGTKNNYKRSDYRLGTMLLLILPLMGADRRVLRVCADPNNLPFSNQSGEGLENKLAELIAKDLGADLRYTWWAERRNFVKNSLNAKLCDLVMGVPSTLDSVLTMRPYYFSTYVFLARADRGLNLASLMDGRLKTLRIGIHLVGDDYAPPAHLLARQGLGSQLVGYSLFGAAGDIDPPSLLVDAVAKGEVDVAIVWGPFAGYFAKRQTVPLTITPVSPSAFMSIPFTYGISPAVRKTDIGFRNEIEEVLARECKSIDLMMTEYGVPLVKEGASLCDSSSQAAASSR